MISEQCLSSILQIDSEEPAAAIDAHATIVRHGVILSIVAGGLAKRNPPAEFAEELRCLTTSAADYGFA
jgi:hypothetical protein